MARPKRELNGKSAFERIEDAFWEILLEKSYGQMTISELSKKAKVNHNLIYYYFNNVDDMAKQLFERNMSEDIPQKILNGLMGNTEDVMDIMNDDEIIKRIMRTRLFMRKDSAFLNGLVKSRIQREWLLHAGVDYEQLTPENKVDLEFIFSGIIAVLGSEQFEENRDALASLHQRILGQGILGTFKSFSK